MKIIVRDEHGIKRCFCQMRDIDYLSTRFTSERFRQFALGNYIFRDLKEDDFFEVKNRAVKKIIEEDQYIVDFGEINKYDNLTLSRMILLSQVPLPTEREKLGIDHKILDLQDIISFNRGMLTYPIPVLFDEKMKFEDGDVVFGSTTLSDHFMLRTNNQDIDLIDYFMENCNSLFALAYPEGEMKSYNIKKVNNDLIIYFEVKKRLFKSLKKRIVG